MKSIDEAAVDYAATGAVSPNGKVMVNFQLEMAFEHGANYVLSAITECMPKTHSFNPNEVIDIIASRIKELKK